MLTIWLLLSVQSPLDALPTELQRAIRGRQMERARIEWSVRRHDSSELPTVRAVSCVTRSESLYSATFEPNEAARPSDRIDYVEPTKLEFLRYDEMTWQGSGSSLAVNVYEDTSRTPFDDARTIGLLPWTVSGPGEGFEALAGYRFTVESDGSLRRVVGRSGDREFRWWIDPERDWSVTRCEVIEAGVERARMEVSLKKYGERWFPAEVSIYQPGHRDGRAPATTIEISQAEFDAEHLPAELTPSDIGVEVGTSIQFLSADGTNTLMLWDGERIDTFQRVGLRVKQGNLELGPRYRADLALARAQTEANQQAGVKESFEPGIAWATRPSAWELFVANFISRYELNAEQAQKAWAFLEQRKQRADAYVKAKGADFERVARLLQYIGELPATMDQAPHRIQFAAEDSRLREPLRKIFDDLVEALESLPTKRQREALESRSRVDPR